MGDFQKRQDEIRHDLGIKAHILRGTMKMDENNRLKESAQFNKMLTHEQQERCRNTRERMNNVNHMMSNFNGDRMKLKDEINKKADDLLTHLSSIEKNRMDEFKQFQDLLNAEMKERMDLTEERHNDVECLMGSFGATQAKLYAELMDSVAEAQSERQSWADDRREIKEAWMNMTMHKSSAPQDDTAQKHSYMQAKPEHHTANEAQKEERLSPESEETPAEDRLLAVKATVAPFTEGCRFNEIYRNMEGISKAELRGCLSHLIKIHELRRDADDRYHLI